MRGRLGHRHAHARTGFLQQAHQFCGLVRGDPAGDADNNAFVMQIHD